MPKLNVLFVEDDYDTVCGTVSAIERLGHDVVLSRSSSSATKKISEEKFDLIVMDVRLKDEDTQRGEMDTSGIMIIDRLISGEFGALNLNTKFVLYTNQKRSIKQGSIRHHNNFLGIYSKNSYLRFLIKFRNTFG